MDIKKFYTENKNAINITVGVLLLYGIAKGAKMSYSLSKQDFEDEIKKGGILNPLRGRLVLTSPFGIRVNPVTGKPGQFHNGADLVLRGGGSLGADIVAPYSGKVILNNFHTAGGHQVIVDSGYARFGFAHLQSKSPLAVGAIVKKGQVLGKLGNSGMSTGAHLHYTLRLDGSFVDPVNNLPLLREALR